MVHRARSVVKPNGSAAVPSIALVNGYPIGCDCLAVRRESTANANSNLLKRRRAIDGNIG
jgi:hypothetical protein